MRYMTPTVITATAPAWPMASAAKPIARGKTVPPKRPMIIRPDTSFFSDGDDMSAWENITENTLELPKPISQIGRASCRERVCLYV